ncbi:hypothetical protein D4R52_02270, partial [bacterium]
MPPEEQNKLYPVAKLAKVFGYTRDHLAAMCRSGQILGQKSGRSWVTTYQAVAKYQEEVDKVQKLRWNELSEKQSLTPHVAAVVANSSAASLRPASPLSLRGAAATKQSQGEIAVSPRLGGAPRNDSHFVVTAAKHINHRRHWSDVLAAGIYQAGGHFQIAIKLLVGYPVQAGMAVLNSILRAMYWAFNAPIASIASLAKYVQQFSEAAVRTPLYLFEKYGDEFSLVELVRIAKLAKAASGISLVLFIGFSLTYSASNVLGVPMHAVGGEVAKASNRAVYALVKLPAKYSAAVSRFGTEYLPVTKLAFQAPEKVFSLYGKNSAVKYLAYTLSGLKGDARKSAPQNALEITKLDLALNFNMQILGRVKTASDFLGLGNLGS